MIEEIMHLARIEDGKRQIKMEDVDLRELIQANRRVYGTGLDGKEGNHPLYAG